ncbi:halocyanin domain-containing protein [Salinigranum sp. GCM10025319]|uniref:halocyanin domain-containing protein n=1 Tax=Salinigranum sp. GCM10025319 TaxID=3252687 RepID=UPI003622EB61
MIEPTESPTRRRFLRGGTLLVVTGLTGCAGGGGGGGSGGGDGSGGSGSESDGDGDDSGGGSSADTPYDDWLSDAPNYDGTPVDRTGDDTVTVAVGAGNGLFFDPPAVRVSPGTTVVWEWTGRGGQHNVRERNGAFESELASTEGHTYERTFEESGVVEYFCVPHEAVGMKGVVDVVDG